MMVARFRKSLNLRPINSVKHIVDFSAALGSGTQLEIDLIVAKDNPTLAAPADVSVGCAVKWVYLTLEVSANEVVGGAIPNFYMYVWKNPGGNLTDTSPANTGDSDNKKHILHQEMVMFENTATGGNPRNVFKGVIKIPRGKQRFGFEDKLGLVLLSPAVNINLCFQCIYKEFR